VRAVLFRRDLRAELKRAVTDSTAIVTGASSGIGEATAGMLGAAGADTVLVARSAERLEAIQKAIEGRGGRACAHSADLSNVEAVTRLVESIRQCHGDVDVLVNNAGHSIRRSIALSYDRFHDFQRTIDVNYLGPVQLVLGLLPRMRERGQGHLLNVSSLGVLLGAPRFSAYLASKSAFESFLRCIAPEVHPDGVIVTNMYMPLVHTPMIEATRVYRLLPGLTADEAATRICRAVVDRPRRVIPTLGLTGRLLADAVPAPFDGLLGLTYKWSTDSSAARGETIDQLEAPAFAQGILRRLEQRTWSVKG
jgi:short-subunit dehydrogenase